MYTFVILGCFWYCWYCKRMRRWRCDQLVLQVDERHTRAAKSLTLVKRTGRAPAPKYLLNFNYTSGLTLQESWFIAPVFLHSMDLPIQVESAFDCYLNLLQLKDYSPYHLCSHIMFSLYLLHIMISTNLKYFASRGETKFFFGMWPTIFTSVCDIQRSYIIFPGVLIVTIRGSRSIASIFGHYRDAKSAICSVQLT